MEARIRNVAHPARPELPVMDLANSLQFYVRALGFKIWFERPEKKLAYLTLDGVGLLLEQSQLPDTTPGSRRTPAVPPFALGVLLEIGVESLAHELRRLQAARVPLLIPTAERWYRRSDGEHGRLECVIADPDGYLLRLFEDLGTRPRGSAWTPFAAKDLA